MVTTTGIGVTGGGLLGSVLGVSGASLPWYLLLPLVAAFVFALSTLFFKRAFQEGAGVLPAFIFNNAVVALVFQPLHAVPATPGEGASFWHPMLAGALFFAGQLCNFTALRIGDVSLVTPLIGTKVLFVPAVAGLLFGEALRPGYGLAAGLAVAGIFLMGATDLRPGKRMGITSLLALGSGLSFALTDCLIQRWAPAFGSLRFIPWLFGTLGLLSLLAVPALGPGLGRVPPGAWRWMAGAAGLTAVQAVLMTLSIGRWRDATGVNIVYSVRGLGGIVLVWWLGGWFGNVERQEVGGRRMAFRMAGSLLILAAAVAAFIGGGRA